MSKRAAGNGRRDSALLGMANLPPALSSIRYSLIVSHGSCIGGQSLPGLILITCAGTEPVSGQSTLSQLLAKRICCVGGLLGSLPHVAVGILTSRAVMSCWDGGVNASSAMCREPKSISKNGGLLAFALTVGRL
jgi:hypothetical protein